MALCHCAACHRSFSGITAFDAHQVGVEPVICRDPERVGRLTLREDGVWARTGRRPAAWSDDTGAVVSTTLLGVLSALLAVLALGLSLTAAEALGALAPAVTAAVAGASVGVVGAALVVGRWWR